MIDPQVYIILALLILIFLCFGPPVLAYLRKRREERISRRLAHRCRRETTPEFRAICTRIGHCPFGVYDSGECPWSK